MSERPQLVAGHRAALALAGLAQASAAALFLLPDAGAGGIERVLVPLLYAGALVALVACIDLLFRGMHARRGALLALVTTGAAAWWLTPAHIGAAYGTVLWMPPLAGLALLMLAPQLRLLRFALAALLVAAALLSIAAGDAVPTPEPLETLLATARALMGALLIASAFSPLRRAAAL